MATINDIAGEITTDMLKRSDISAMVIKQVKAAYLTICQRVPFEELQTGPSDLTCTIDDPAVDLSSLAIAGICSIRIVYSATSGMRLKRNHVRNFDNYATTLASNKPREYARWGKKIELSPPPKEEYVLKIRYWTYPTIANPVENTTLAMPSAWEELLKWESFHRVLIVLKRPEEAQSLVIPSMQPKMPTSKKVYSSDMGIIPRLWNELLLTVPGRESIDEDFSINPVRF